MQRRKIGHQQSRASQEHHSEPDAFPLAKTQVLRGLAATEKSPPVEFGKNPQDEPKRGGECDIPSLLPAHTERRRIELPDILVTLVTSRTASSRTNDQQTEPPSALLVRTTLV